MKKQTYAMKYSLLIVMIIISTVFCSCKNDIVLDGNTYQYHGEGVIQVIEFNDGAYRWDWTIEPFPPITYSSTNNTFVGPYKIEDNIIYLTTENETCTLIYDPINDVLIDSEVDFKYINIKNVGADDTFSDTEYTNDINNVPTDINVAEDTTSTEKDEKIEENNGISTDDETEKIDTIIVDNTPLLKVGESSTTDKSVFYIDYINITNDVMPPQPGSWYSHYEAEAGKKYVDFCIAYKNTDTTNISSSETLSGKLIYSGKYEYSGFSIIEEDSRTDFTYSANIMPLSTEYIHYLFEVPEEVETSSAEIILKMNIGGEEYKVVVREGNGIITDNSNTQTGKTSGAVVLGETVVTKNSEFYIDYSNVTNDVMPPQPDSWYSHYEAEVGKVYVDICFAYKNTSGKNVVADDVISAKLKYAEKYDYTGFSMIEEDSRADFTYSSITSIAPLSTEYIHYLFEVPEEVKSSTEPIEITFTIDRNTYTYIVR